MSEDTAAVEAAPEATDETATEPAKGTEQAPEAFDAARAQEKIRKVNSEAKALREKLKEYEPLIAEANERREAQKTESQKLTERLAATEKERDEFRSTTTRLFAAATHNIPPDLIDLLGTGTDEEIDARARLLAAKLAPAPVEEQATVPASRRPVESLRPGASPQSQVGADDPNAWIRRMTGRE